MKIHKVPGLRSAQLLLFCLAIASMAGQDNLNINDFSGPNNSFGLNISMENGVTTISPEGNQNGLDVSDLNAFLQQGDVVLQAPTGSVIFASGLFSPQNIKGKLSIRALNDVTFSVPYSNKFRLILDIRAKRNILIDGPGISSRSGKIYMEGKNIRILETGIKSGGGDIELCASDTLQISGAGIQSQNGGLVLDCDHLRINMNGTHTQKGKTRLNVRKTGIIDGIGIHTQDLSAVGASLETSGDGIDATGFVYMDFSKDVKIFREGILMHGEPLFIRARNLTIGGNEHHGGSGIRTQGGKVTFEISNKLIVQARGLFAGNGQVDITCGKDIDVKFGGITTNNQNIKLESLAGNITLAGMNLNSQIDRQTTGGSLDTSRVNQQKLKLVTEPVVGGGNITIITH